MEESLKMDSKPTQDILPPAVDPEILELVEDILSKVEQIESQTGLSNENPSRNLANTLNPFLIDNVLVVLLPNLTKKKLFDVRQVCRFWNQKCIEEINYRRNLCSANFDTSADIGRFHQLIGRNQDLRPHFHNLIINGCQNMNNLSLRPDFSVNFNNVKEYTFYMSNQILVLSNFHRILCAISGSVQKIKIKYKDTTIFNNCLRGVVNKNWSQDISFPALKSLQLDVIPIWRFRFFIPIDPTLKESDEAVQYLMMYIKNAPNLKELKLISENCGAIDILLRQQGFGEMLQKLDSLEIKMKCEMTSYWARIRLMWLVQQYDIRLKNFGYTCFYNINHHFDPNLNRLQREYDQIYQFFISQSTTLESLKLSIWQSGPYFLTRLSIPPMAFLRKLTFTSKGLGSILSGHLEYENVEERPQSAVPMIYLSEGFPMLTNLKLVGQHLYLRNFLRIDQLASESIIDLEIKSSNYGQGAEFDSSYLNLLFPKLRRLYLNQSNIMIPMTMDLTWPASLSEIELKITSAIFTIMNWSHFKNATGLSVLKLSEWRESNAARIVSKPNLDSMSKIMDRVEKLTIRGFKVEKSLILDLEEMFGEKVDLDFTTTTDGIYCYL